MRVPNKGLLGLTMMLLSMSACRADEPQNMKEALDAGYRVTGFSARTINGFAMEETFILSKGASLILCIYNGTDQTERFCSRLN